MLFAQVTGFGYDHDEAWAANVELFKQFTDASRGVRRLGAAAVDLCHTALGESGGPEHLCGAYYMPGQKKSSNIMALRWVAGDVSSSVWEREAQTPADASRALQALWTATGSCG